MHWCVKLSLLLLLLHLPVFAQDQKALETTIRHEDTAFWDAYNHCDVEKMSQFFWPDIEFYHDQGGLTVGLGPFVEILKTGLCGKPNEAVDGHGKGLPASKERRDLRGCALGRTLFLH